MAELVLTNARVLVAGYDLTGDLTSTQLALDADMVDKTKMGATARAKMPGLISGAFTHEGLFEAGADTVDPELFSLIGLDGQPVTMSPDGGDDGEVAFLFNATHGQYAPGAAIGEAFAFSVGGETTGVVARGTMMHNSTRTSSANGTTRQLGAVASGQRLYCAIHAHAVSGTLPTLDAVVESADNAGMTGATERIVFTQITARGGQLLSVAGPITDDYWRIALTIGGTSPSFAVAVSMGIK